MRKILLVQAMTLVVAIAFSQEPRIVLQNVNIVDVEKGIILPKKSVAIQGGRIVSTGNASQFPRQANDSIVSCTGQYLIPGLWDMHTHVWVPDYYFSLFVANGVTGHRGMLENITAAANWRQQGNTAGTLYPAGFYAGPVADGPKPTWPGSVAISDTEQARRTVDSLKNKLHTDFIKVYSGLSREHYYAIAEEAKKLNFPFAGHVPGSMTLAECVRAGQKSVEHMMGFMEEASDSSDYYWGMMRGTIEDTVLRNSRSARRAFLARTFSEKKLLSLIGEMKKNEVWICPTMTVNRGIAYLNDTSMARDPRLKYVMPMMKNNWNPANDFRFRDAAPDYFDIEKREYAVKKKIIKLLHQGGVKLLAGTDTPNPYCIPGFSLHDELEIFVESGLTPAQALQTATLNPAIFFNILNDYGTIAENKWASLVLLKENPLKNISNTKQIAAVILRGKFIGANGLGELLAKAGKMAGN